MAEIYSFTQAGRVDHQRLALDGNTFDVTYGSADRLESVTDDAQPTTISAM